MKLPYLLLTAAFVLADQLSKYLLIDLMQGRGCTLYRGLPHLCEPVHVLPFFDLVMVWNRGVSFGLFPESGAPLLFAAINIVVGGALVFWLIRAKGALLSLSLVAVASGAFGNAIDRFVWGAVADFFDVYATGAAAVWLIDNVGVYHWPAFNLADSLIFLGVVGLLSGSLFGEREGSNKAA